MLRQIRGILLACAGLSYVAPAAAQEPPVEPVRIEYVAPAECPARAEFVAGVLGRTERARLSSAGERSRSFEIVLRQDGAGFAGHLVITDLEGRASARDVKGATCESVASALGLIVALAVDPRASATPRSEPASKVDEPAAKTSPKRAATPPVAKGRAGPARRPAPPPSKAQPGGRVEWAAGAGVIARGLVAPHVVPGATVFGQFRAIDAAMRPAGRLALLYAVSSDVETPAGTARFDWAAARLDLCLPELVLARTLSVCPGAGIEIGGLRAEGSETRAGRSVTRLWGAFTALARLDWRPSAVFAYLEGAMVVPATRDRFVFDVPETVAYEPAPIGAMAGTGFGIRFP